MQTHSQVVNTPSIITGNYGKFSLNKTFSGKFKFLKSNIQIDAPELVDIILIENGGERIRASSFTFNDTGDTFACSDSVGNIFAFYTQKNRFVNVCKRSNPTAICLTEKQNGLLFLGTTNKQVEIYNLGISLKVIHYA